MAWSQFRHSDLLYKLMKQILRPIYGLMLLGFAIAAPAFPTSGPSGGAQAATPEAAPVEGLDAALISAMKAGSAKQSFASRYQALDAAVKSAYDIPMVTQNSVGFLWSTLPAGQQAELTDLFEQFTTSSYAAEFSAYGGEQLNVLPAEKSLGTKKIVETQLIPGGGGSPTELDYVVNNTPQGWRITDVLLNGTISQVAVHESDFASLVSGGDASQLIAALKTKIAALQAGPSS